MNKWTPEESNLLFDLWEQGLSVSDIRERIQGRSKNSIISRAKRIGCTVRENPVKSPETYKGKVGRKKAVVQKSGRGYALRETPSYKVGRPSGREQALAALPEKLIHFWDIDGDMCRYMPHDDRMCCGRTVTGRNAYCDAHMDVLTMKAGA